eukprot:gene8196-9265_t
MTWADVGVAAGAAVRVRGRWAERGLGTHARGVNVSVEAHDTVLLRLEAAAPPPGGRPSGWARRRSGRSAAPV